MTLTVSAQEHWTVVIHCISLKDKNVTHIAGAAGMKVESRSVDDRREVRPILSRFETPSFLHGRELDYFTPFCLRKLMWFW